MAQICKYLWCWNPIFFLHFCWRSRELCSRFHLSITQFDHQTSLLTMWAIQPWLPILALILHTVFGLNLNPGKTSRRNAILVAFYLFYRITNQSSFRQFISVKNIELYLVFSISLIKRVFEPIVAVYGVTVVSAQKSSEVKSYGRLTGL